VLVNIQFLRFAAAFLVVLYHASKHVANTGVDQGLLFQAAQAAGFAGVDVFFVISGFIMYHTTVKANGPGASLDFLKRRVARIYSGYWPFFILAAIVFAWARPAHFEASNLLTSFLLWPAPLHEVLLDVSWTLSYEMYFYALFTALILLPLRGRYALLTLILLAVTAFNLLRHFALQSFDPENYYYNTFEGLFYSSPFLAEFFAGAVLARFAARGAQARGWLLLIAGIGGFAAAGYANATAYQGMIEQGFYVVPRVLLFGIPSVLILWGLVNLEANGRVAPRAFSLAAGGASYAIYLSHTIFFVATMKLGIYAAMKGWPALAVQSGYLLYSLLIVALSVAWYRGPERALHGLFRKALGVSRSR